MKAIQAWIEKYLVPVMNKITQNFWFGIVADVNQGDDQANEHGCEHTAGAKLGQIHQVAAVHADHVHTKHIGTDAGKSGDHGPVLTGFAQSMPGVVMITFLQNIFYFFGISGWVFTPVPKKENGIISL